MHLLHLLHLLFSNSMIDKLAIDLSSGGHKMCVKYACLLDKCFSPPLRAGFFFAAWHEQRAACSKPVAFYPGKTQDSEKSGAKATCLSMENRLIQSGRSSVESSPAMTVAKGRVSGFLHK